MDIYDAHSYMEYAMDDVMPKAVSTFSSYESLNIRGMVKPQDFRITELEEKLVTAETRCSELRKQVAYMRMLYTSAHHIPASNDSDLEKIREDKTVICQTEEGLINNVSSPEMLLDAENLDSQFRVSTANTSKTAPNAAALPDDPKETMEWIVNEMTQSLNAMDSANTFNIQSNTTEKVLPSKSKKRRVMKRKMPQYEPSKSPPHPTKKLAASQNRIKVKEEKPLLSSLSSFKVAEHKPTAHSPSTKPERKKQLPRSKTGLKTWTRAQMCPKKSRLDPNESSKEVQVRTFDSVLQTPTILPNLTGQLPKRSSSTYLLPTLSYRMKCVPKNYGSRVNFRRIPFVVGKSTTKTHNLGSKIQETLSLIKLSRKGIPTSASSKTELNELLTDAPATSDLSFRTPYAGSGAGSNNNGPSAAPDCKNGQLRTVLLNLHDEFGRMNDEHEDLKALLRKKHDPELVKQVRAMEEALNAKEAEIEVFMNLFNEVSELKEKLTSGFSLPSVIGRPMTANLAPTDSTPTLKLIKLLRRIETFQSQLKNTSYV